ncbi:hypothetical protein GFC29_2341 [Anoxybacillus sp. B7M1]|uniref:DUF3221 domain-containing protein n=1 Tax=unclassified Anoxybacillus TaxID=2639704 RepID=UPI0005CC982D|nr:MULTISPECIES: DUF3221 domain-containing protein [unclassified Anoxybacillus]ANB59035.1 hypothetical protein GFC28_3094 [Anoxybacillus sp. B2M1]ANB65881.1 hypothetical protein GFC29_2341 [Anoxybacillus sp. B7M1]
MKKILFIPTLLVLFILIPFVIVYFNKDTSTDHQDLAKFEGYVVLKDMQKDAYRVLLMKNISKDDIYSRSVDELLDQGRRELDTMWLWIKKKDYGRIQKGQRVVVWYGPEVQDSNPPQSSAKQIQILDE